LQAHMLLALHQAVVSCCVRATPAPNLAQCQAAAHLLAAAPGLRPQHSPREAQLRQRVMPTAGLAWALPWQTTQPRLCQASPQWHRALPTLPPAPALQQPSPPQTQCRLAWEASPAPLTGPQLSAATALPQQGLSQQQSTRAAAQLWQSPRVAQLVLDPHLLVAMPMRGPTGAPLWLSPVQLQQAAASNAAAA